MTLPKYKIVDCGVFYEVIFFYISAKNLLEDFFYSLKVKAHRGAVFCVSGGRVMCSPIVLFYSSLFISPCRSSLTQTSKDNLVCLF